MSVSLNPSNSLGFKRPLTQLVKRSLTITNHNTQPIAFKVKTTAPKLYCVRPNSGRVEPGESLDVSVMLQALREEPPLSAKCKDKFLIQSTLITAEKETMALHDIWAAPEGSEESKVHQQKLRVAYLPADGQTLEEEDEHLDRVYDPVAQHPITNGHREAEFVEPPPQEAPRTPPGDFSVARDISREEGHEVPPITTQQPPVPTLPPLEPDLVREPTPNPELQHAPGPALAFVPMLVPEPVVTSTESPDAELLAKYEAARAEIERLKATLAAMAASPPDEFRRRNRALSDDGASVADTEIATTFEDSSYQHHQEGVPLQVVVIIALGVFITTYLFF